MGKTQTGKSYQVPSYAASVQPAAEQLGSFFGQQGTEVSPFYNALSSMFQNTLGNMGNMFQLPDYITNTLESAAQTGLPSLTPLEQTPWYKAVQPTFESVINEQILPSLKESFGAQGALRTSDYATAAGKGVTQGIGSLITQAAQQAYALEEAAKARQLQGATTGIQAAAAPLTMATQGAQAGAGIDASKYPLLAAMLSYLQTGAGQAGQASQYQPNFGMNCCFIFNEGEGEITDAVREYRDEHYGHNGWVAKGYKMMAKELVPFMKEFNWIRQSIRYLMTKPLTRVARNYYNLDPSGWVFKPLAWFWTLIWSGSARVRYIVIGGN